VNGASKLERYAVWGLFVVAVVILFTRLGTFPLQMQWEPNYGQVVREMVWGEGDLITPTSKVGSDEGAAPGTFWSKPILIFWLAYPFYAAFGDGEWSARLPIGILGTLVILFTYWFMARLYTPRIGLLAGLVLLTSPCYFLISRAFMVDLPFVGAMWVAIGFLLLGEKENRRLFYDLFYVFMGVSSLAKGLTPLILVGVTILAYCLISMDWALLKRMRLVRGGIIYLIVASPWYVYMTAKYGAPYVKKFFWDHHVERSLGNIDKPNDSFQMFVLYFSIGVLPWLTFLPQALATIVPWRGRAADRRGPELFFLTGFFMIFSFFSIISTKFVHYIFPAVPFVAMVVALYIDRLFSEDGRREIGRFAFLIALLVLGIVAPDLLDMKNYRTLFYFITTERLQDWHPNVADPTYFFSVVFILWGLVLGASFVLRRFNRWFFAVLVALAVVYAFYINMVTIPTLTEMFAARSMLRTYLELRASPDEPIGEFTQTWKSRSIKYYIPFDELKDEYDYRYYRLSDNVQSVRRFYEKYKDKRVFIIIEQKQKHFSRINALWQEVTGGEQLVKIADDAVHGEPYRPEFWLVSNRDSVGQAKHVTAEEMESQLKEFVREEPFTPGTSLLVDFEGEIQLIGFDPLPAKHAAGQDLEITLYFKALKTPSRDYEVFIHAERDKLFRLRGDHVPVDGRYPARRWTEGQYIKDTYKLDVPPDTTPGDLGIYIGLFKGNYRAKTSEVPQRDAEGRILLSTVEIVNP